MLRAFACALLFLTRVPLPTMKLDERDMARSPAWFAWVGALIAASLWAVSQLQPVFGARLTSMLVIVAWVALSGGLHLDGVADTADGISGGRGDRDRTLLIMRDSRIGAHGAVALVLTLALKWASLERALELETPAWLMAPIAARFACTLLIAWFPYARTTGLGRPFVDAVRWPALLVGALAVSCAGFLLGRAAPVSAVCAVVAALLFAQRMRTHLDGLTGDIYGAAAELAEVVALLATAGLYRALP